MMNLKRILLLAAVICLCRAFFATAQDDIRRDATVNAVEMVMPTVVNIATRSVVPVQNRVELQMRQALGQQPYDEYVSAGSGVMIDEAGYLLTNEHVVHGADEIAVRFGTETNEYEATVVASNAKIDVALLKLKSRPGEKFRAIKIAREDDLLLGETVIALGNPLGFGGSVTRGILSAKSRVALRAGEKADYPNLLQTDAPINHGNSGGPLVNLRGELIGINAQVINQDPVSGDPVQGIGFAIPIRLIERALSEIPTEYVRSYWFGARVKVGSYPLVVASVQPESPAGRAGLKPGDVVLQVNGTVPKTFMEFGDLLVSNPAVEIPITIRRGEENSDVNVRLVRIDSVFNNAMVRNKLGLSLDKNPNGFIITNVESNSPASSVGLQTGMIVYAVDLQDPPEDVPGVAELLYEKKKGDPVRLNVAFVQQVSNQQGIVFRIPRREAVEIHPR